MKTAAPPTGALLVLNVGSSSLKFAAYPATGLLAATATGTVEGLDQRDRWLELALQQAGLGASGHRVCAVGHRLVHGGQTLVAPTRVTPAVLAELRRLIPFAPEHLPGEIALIEAVAKKYPKLPQVVCFDTAFHHDLPPEARLLPVPRRYEAEGLRRYGFHGLSYDFLRGELVRLKDPAVKRGRVILAHLGNGASLAALRHGACVDTTMGFTPAGGIVMGSRSGDLDPGVVLYLAQKEKWGPERVSRLINHESGLKGISETESDMKKLVALAPTDPRAAEAIAIFCRQARKAIGSFAAVLGGLDTLVFAGGIGEHDATIRARICAGLEFLGLGLDQRRNRGHAPVISAAKSGVTVRVIRTDEEIVIARAMRAVLAAK